MEVFHAVFARFRSLKGEFALNAITGKCGPARASGSGGEATPMSLGRCKSKCGRLTVVEWHCRTVFCFWRHCWLIEK